MRRAITLIAMLMVAMTSSLVSATAADARTRPPGFACWADERAVTWTDQRQIVQGTPEVTVFVTISTYPDPSDVTSICVFPENSAGTVRIVADPGDVTLGTVTLTNQIGQGPPRGMKFTGAGDVSVSALAPGVYTIRTDYGIDQQPSGVPLTVIAPPPPVPPVQPRPCSIFTNPGGCPS